jgi:hypothetical protein
VIVYLQNFLRCACIPGIYTLWLFHEIKEQIIQIGRSAGQVDNAIVATKELNKTKKLAKTRKK